MVTGTEPQSYSGGQKALHWAIALLILPMIPIGFYMVDRGEKTNFDALTNTLYTNHKTIGFVILMLVALRVVTRLRRGAPAPVSTLTPFERFASEAVHKGLYALMVLTPLLGWAGVSAYPARGILFGLSLPPIMPVNETLAKILLQLHGFSALALAALIGAHFAGAMMHAIVKKDGVMRRMMPGN
jgi:cytochrome b561